MLELISCSQLEFGNDLNHDLNPAVQKYFLLRFTIVIPIDKQEKKT